MATPCWPAPVSAMTRRLPMRRGQQRLPEHVVDLVGAGVAEVLALEEHGGPGPLREPGGMVEGGGPAGVVGKEARQLRLEGGVAARLLVGLRQLVERRHQRLGHVPASVRSEAGLNGHQDSASRVAGEHGTLGVADGGKERPQERRVLLAGRALDAAGDIDGQRANQVDRQADVVGSQAAGQHQAAAVEAESAHRRPVQRTAVPP